MKPSETINCRCSLISISRVIRIKHKIRNKIYKIKNWIKSKFKIRSKNMLFKDMKMTNPKVYVENTSIGWVSPIEIKFEAELKEYDKDFLDAVFLGFHQIAKENEEKENKYFANIPLDDWPAELLDRIFDKD